MSVTSLASTMVCGNCGSTSRWARRMRPPSLNSHHPISRRGVHDFVGQGAGGSGLSLAISGARPPRSLPSCSLGRGRGARYRFRCRCRGPAPPFQPYSRQQLDQRGVGWGRLEQLPPLLLHRLELEDRERAGCRTEGRGDRLQILTLEDESVEF